MSVTVAACQCAVDDLDTPANCARLEERVADLPARTDLAVLPEQFLTGFVADGRIADVALSRGTALDHLRPLAAEHDLALLVGYVEREGGERYNASAYVAPDGNATVYRKRHLWANEADWVRAGDERATVETPLGTAGLLTCYDLNFVAESAAFTRERVDALLVTGAWPAPHVENWRLLVRARALDGVRWVVGANRAGRKDLAGVPPHDYAGRSLVARPNGQVRASLGVAPDTLVVDLDRSELSRHRETVGIFEADE